MRKISQNSFGNLARYSLRAGVVADMRRKSEKTLVRGGSIWGPQTRFGCLESAGNRQRIELQLVAKLARYSLRGEK